MKRFLNWIIDRVMAAARRDPDITLTEYRELEKDANELRAKVNK
jgi:hypothetical protein